MVRQGAPWSKIDGHASAARFFRALFAALCLFTTLPCQSAGAGDSLEYPIKATYLYKFAPFVEWPSSSLGSADGPIAICIVGTDPFGALLDRAIAGQRVSGRPLIVRRLPTIAAESGCQIAFLSGSPDQSIAQALDVLRGQPVLTVTDNAADNDSRGIIGFMMMDNRVRFQIDERAALQNHLEISSKLLSLSRRPGQAS